MGSTSVTLVLARFLERQEDRARTYQQLHESFKKMLESKEEQPFLSSIPERTQTFVQISKDIIEMEQQLQQIGGECGMECARWIRTVQLGEKSKLRATTQLHALRKAYEFKDFTWQQQGSIDESDIFSPMDIVSEAGFREEMKKNTLALDEAIQQINDALDEIRCIKIDAEMQESNVEEL